MPISVPHAFRPLPQSEFAQLDYQVMRLAFESQNKFNRPTAEAKAVVLVSPEPLPTAS